MTIGGFAGVFVIAATKFLFAPSTALIYNKFTFWETIIVCIIGGVIGTTFFYFLGEAIFLLFAKSRQRKDEKKRAQGIIVVRKKFSKGNRRIIRIKRRFGLWGIGFVTPCIISIPIGSVLAARFYHHRYSWRTLLVIYFWVIFWAFVLTYFNDVVYTLIA